MKPQTQNSQKSSLASIFLHKDVRAAFISIIFVVLGFAVIYLSKRIIDVDSELVIICLLLLPVIIYSICSGRLGEFKVGDVEAKFASLNEQAKDSITSELNSEQVSINEVEMQLVNDDNDLKSVDKTKNVVLTITLGSSYELPACRHYVKSLLSRYINFKFVVFLDEEERFIAYTTSRAILQLLESDRGNEFVEAINNKRKSQLLKCPGVVKERVLVTETNLGALRKMVQKNLEAIVVTEDDDIVAGLVERGHLTSKLLLELAN
jgi:hypothetical protein